jgi:hypothetical protein
VAVTLKNLEKRELFYIFFYSELSPVQWNRNGAMLAAGYGHAKFWKAKNFLLEVTEQQRAMYRNMRPPASAAVTPSPVAKVLNVLREAWPTFERPKVAESKPPESRFAPERILSDPQLGEHVISANGGRIPVWARDPGMGGAFDFTEEAQRRIDARRRAESALIMSYVPKHDPLLGPPPLSDSPYFTGPTAGVASVAYKDEGVDTIGDVSKLPQGTIAGQAAEAQASEPPEDDFQREIFYASPEAKLRYLKMNGGN